MSEVERQDYRNSFSELNHFAVVDFFKSPERPTGQNLLGVKEAVVTPDLSTHLHAEPNQDCPNICHHEEMQIAELEAYIRQLDDRYF